MGLGGMSVRFAAIGFSVLAGMAMANAQDTKPARVAAVDADGRILPLADARVAIERIDGTSVGTSPCPNARAMAADEARALVVRIATAENFYPDFVQSVAKIESHFNSTALSDKGAVGLMQLEPETAQRFKVDRCDPADNVRGGVRFLRALQNKYRNPLFILAAYNAGEGAVDSNRGVPPFPETVRFVARVINDFYTWPAPGHADSRRALHRKVADRPDLIEPGSTRAPPQTSAPTPPGQARWDDGFVMHVD